MRARWDVAIVGAGPVGLLLGSLLSKRGLEVCVLERAHEPGARTRAIGIHPPGLECLAEIGAADELAQRGIRVQKGLALSRDGVLGSIDFAALPPPYPFVLTVPQPWTERVLEHSLARLAPDALRRRVSVERVDTSEHGARVFVRHDGAHDDVLDARYVVACDGRHSAVRRELGIAFEGQCYADRFVMGDAPDTTDFGEAAAIYIDPAGLVESFPLPGQKRRWVVRLPANAARPADATTLLEHVAERTGHALAPGALEHVSTFRPERLLARSLVRGRCVLAGDAAHVVSPIGGQGMNLGWLDARELADTLSLCFSRPTRADDALARYARHRRRAAHSAAHRSELFMTLGRPRLTPMRRRAVRALLSSSLAPSAARLFTMRGV